MFIIAGISLIKDGSHFISVTSVNIIRENVVVVVGFFFPSEAVS